MKTLFFALSFSFISSATCFKKEDVTVQWTAFKTPSKVGVNGWFKDLGLKDQYQGEDITSALEDINFEIDTNSTNTKNAGRDLKIVNFFFKKAKGEKITGKIKNISDSETILTLKMNNKEVEVPLTNTITKNEFIAKGVIDIFDFNMHESLKGINQACEQLHLGKTWNDVEVMLKVIFKKTCK